ncbi:hypothetical protein [Pseudomonas sp. NPDC086251]
MTAMGSKQVILPLSIQQEWIVAFKATVKQLSRYLCGIGPQA